MIVSRNILPENSTVEAIHSLVVVIDDDDDMRDSLGNLLRSIKLHVALFASIGVYKHARLPDVPTCVILDIRLPGASGLDLQSHFNQVGERAPIIFMTGHGDILMSVRVMKAGAFDFLTKPLRDHEILDVVTDALECDSRRRKAEEAVVHIRDLYETLTPREKEVMVSVTRGLINKQIACELDIQEITAKIYRGNMMRKMAAKSVADLVRFAEALGINDSWRMRRAPIMSLVACAGQASGQAVRLEFSRQSAI